jgi:hypothetical protein
MRRSHGLAEERQVARRRLVTGGGHNRKNETSSERVVVAYCEPENFDGAFICTDVFQ